MWIENSTSGTYVADSSGILKLCNVSKISTGRPADMTAAQSVKAPV